ncbi:MAG: DNA-directed RNA polymerase subunit alpha C-terminal domain-containing protein [Mucilaginibacter sp.]|uniref:DNA-directed RNA polymerase subunit alpha C-terminal domain-containing protein n=1 Tax=Mucilaginibacter sp. TaxID=1882438 RepID=UPI003264DCA3
MQNQQSPFQKLSNPAQRALANAGIKTLKELSTLTEKQFLSLHGVGKGSLKPVKLALEAAGLSFA